MTISDELTKLNTNLTDSYTAVSNKGGTLPASENFDNLPNAINSITELKGETKTVTPTTSQQTITPSNGKNGITQVTVNAVTSAIDSDIQAGNIKSGVSILGVNGTVTELKGETRSVSITSASGNTFTPTSGKNGITSITVTPTNQNRTVTPTTSQQTLSVNSGYSGNGTITVNAVTSSIDSDIVAGNIKSGVNILGVNGTLTPANNTSLSITPTTSAQSYTPSSPYTGYSPVNVSAVTSAIDSNIKASNIKSGVTILGVTGTCGATNYNYIEDSSGNATLMTKNSSVLGLSQTEISGEDAFAEAYINNTLITKAKLDKITTISGVRALQNAFKKSTITILSLSSLETITGGASLGYICRQCSNLIDVNLNSLSSVNATQALTNAFMRCTGLNSKIISFPSLKSTSFGNYTNQFDNMLSGVTGCKVHFPSNLQSVIGSWASVTAGFGGTNTTILFDLPATE